MLKKRLSFVLSLLLALGLVLPAKSSYADDVVVLGRLTATSTYNSTKTNKVEINIGENNSTTPLQEVSVGSEFTIEFLNKSVNPHVSIDMKTSETKISNFMTIIDTDSSSTNLIGDYFKEPTYKDGNQNSFKAISIKLKKPLIPNKTYKIQLDTTKISIADGSSISGNASNGLSYFFNTESPKVLEVKAKYNELTIKLDRAAAKLKPVLDENDILFVDKADTTQTNLPISKVLQSKSTNVADNLSLSQDGKTITIKSLKPGDYTVKVNTNTNTKTLQRLANAGDNSILSFEPYTTTPPQYIKITNPPVPTKVASNVTASVYEDGALSNKSISSNKTSPTSEVSLETGIDITFQTPYKVTDKEKAFTLENITTPAALKIVPTLKNVNTGATITFDKLTSDTKYRLQLNKDYFKDANNNSPSGTDRVENYYFTTESLPTPSPISDPLYAMEKDQTITIPYNKNIEIVDQKKIMIDDKPTQATVDGKNLVITVSAANAKALTVGAHKINLGQNNIKRKGSKAIFSDKTSVDLTVKKDPAVAAKEAAEKAAAEAAKKAAEEAKKAEEEKAKKAAEEAAKKAKEKLAAEKEARDIFRNSVAKALIAEMEKRYQAEYGSDSMFKTFDDYMRDDYIKRNGKAPTDASYTKKYLEDRGYIDDFISKYGHDNPDLKASAIDYMNRYGSFVYRSGRRYDNPFYQDPFSSPSSKNGYYDNYNYYDYGYRFPKMREGDDSVSTANLELTQKLRDKEQELLNLQKGYAMTNNSKYRPTAVNSPRIVVNSYSRYVSYEDQFGNTNQTDMGVTPVSTGGRTFVPIAALADLSGAWLNYDNSTKIATVSRPGKTASVSASSSYITLNGKSENMGIRPMVVSGKIMIPVQYLAKVLGLEENQVSYSSGQIIIQR
nr:stalk domain-containing protein [uncultured Criibacterium sp.]